MVKYVIFFISFICDKTLTSGKVCDKTLTSGKVYKTLTSGKVCNISH